MLFANAQIALQNLSASATACVFSTRSVSNSSNNSLSCDESIIPRGPNQNFSCDRSHHRLAELGAAEEFDGFAVVAHEAFEVVGDLAGGYGPVDAFEDEVGGLFPAHVAEHHFAGEDDAAGVDLVLIGVLGGGAVGGLEDGVAGVVVDVAAGGDADAADLSGQSVGKVIAVEVQCRDHIEISRSSKHLL